MLLGTYRGTRHANTAATRRIGFDKNMPVGIVRHCNSTWQIYSFQFVLFSSSSSSSSSSPTQLSLFSRAYIPLFRLFTALL
jgi:hypothetical protein